MRIAVVVDTYDNMGNGTTVSARRFVNALRERGHFVKVLCFSKTPEPDKIMFDEYHIPLFQHFVYKNNANFAKPDKNKIREALADVDFVHICIPLIFGCVVAKVAHEMGKPIFTAFHMHPGNFTYSAHIQWIPGIEKLIFHLTHKHFYSYSNDIHCPTQYCVDICRAHGYKQNMHVISNGYDASRFYKKAVERPEKWKDKFVIIAVGRFNPEKKQDVLIKAIAKSPYKNRIKLVLAGSGPTQKKLEKLARKYNVDAEFGFIKNEELPNVLNCCDLYVHSAQVEIESISCMEAFACGVVPVIGNSKDSATKYFALDDRSIFKDGDSAHLESRIRYWIEHPEELKIMSDKYAEHAKQYDIKYSIDKLEKTFYEFYLRNCVKSQVVDEEYKAEAKGNAALIASNNESKAPTIAISQEDEQKQTIWGA